MEMRFRYHAAILARFPNICGGVILAQELHNSPTPAAFQETFLAEQRLVLQRIGQTPLSELPSLAAWRQAFRAFGADPTKYRSACEALLRRLTKKGELPSINHLVDICNLVSIRYALPVAAFDLRRVTGAITVQFASGQEHFTAHDQPEGETPAPGEVIFADESGLVAARRWCWKQSLESTVDLDTRQTLITIEAQHPGGSKDIRAALQDLADLLKPLNRGALDSQTLGQAG